LIVSGSPKALVLLRRLFQQKMQKAKDDPTHVFSIQMDFLATSCAFHSAHMQADWIYFAAIKTELVCN